MEHMVIVHDKSGRRISSCKKKTAERLIKRHMAIWTGDNKIQRVMDDEDKDFVFDLVIEQDWAVCYICGQPIPEGDEKTVDHLDPRGKGGSDYYSNLKCACKRCNLAKDDMSLADFIKCVETDRKDYPYVTDRSLERMHAIARLLRMKRR